MGLFDFLKSTLKPVMKNLPLDAVEVKNTPKKKWHYGVCGMGLTSSDWLCPAFGGTPIDQNGKVKK